MPSTPRPSSRQIFGSWVVLPDPVSPATITPSFRSWLVAEGYPEALLREDLVGGAFGGRTSATDCEAHRPVVFVHGNGDRAWGGDLGGWATVATALEDAGWEASALYATTYGPADPTQAALYQHDVASLTHVRQFLLAVSAYTGASRIDVVSHSLGVTMARRAILGGEVPDGAGGIVDLGPPLTDRIGVFVGIAGANLGLASCAGVPTPVCGSVLGLDPGVAVGTGVQGRSRVLQQMEDATPHFEGQRVVSLWSAADTVIGAACVVWGRNTCAIQGQDGQAWFRFLDHLGVRDDTTATLITWLSSPL